MTKALREGERERGLPPVKMKSHDSKPIGRSLRSLRDGLAAHRVSQRTALALSRLDHPSAVSRCSCSSGHGGFIKRGGYPSRSVCPSRGPTNSISRGQDAVLKDEKEKAAPIRGGSVQIAFRLDTPAILPAPAKGTWTLERVRNW